MSGTSSCATVKVVGLAVSVKPGSAAWATVRSNGADVEPA